MSLNSGLIFTVILGSLLVVQVYSNPTFTTPKPLSCYTCDNCPDPENGTLKIPESKSQPCKAGINTCFKFFHSDKTVQRGCSPVNEECPDDKAGKLRLTWCYHCYGGNCNTGRRSVEVSSAALGAGLMIGFIALILKKND